VSRGLTSRQAEALDVISEHIDKHGRPPTLREIGDAMGIGSTNGVSDHLRALERKGFLRTDKGLSRGIYLVQPHRWKWSAMDERARIIDYIKLMEMVGEENLTNIAEDIRNGEHL